MQPLTLSPAAQQDVRRALQWSARKFGSAAAGRYSALLTQAFRHLQQDPFRPGSRSYSASEPSFRTHHLSSSRERGPKQVKRPRHLIIYRAGPKGIEVARVLYDTSDFERHLSDEYHM